MVFQKRELETMDKFGGDSHECTHKRPDNSKIYHWKGGDQKQRLEEFCTHAKETKNNLHKNDNEGGVWTLPDFVQSTYDAGVYRYCFYANFGFGEEACGYRCQGKKQQTHS